MKRNFFKKGQYKPAVIDPNDPEVKELLDQSKKTQEKYKKLRKNDPNIGDLFINCPTHIIDG